MNSQLKAMKSASNLMEVQLKAISPVAFTFAKEGDKAVVKRNPPKLREYRDKIGPANEAFLVFKGETKIGMIPHEFIAKLGTVKFKRICSIVKMDPLSDLIIVKLFSQEEPTA